MDAVKDVAEYVGDVDEIGTSDVSGWVAQVEDILRSNPKEGEIDEKMGSSLVNRRQAHSFITKFKKPKFNFEEDDVDEAAMSDKHKENHLAAVRAYHAKKKADAEQRRADSRAAFGSMFGGSSSDLTKNLKIRDESKKKEVTDAVVTHGYAYNRQDQRVAWTKEFASEAEAKEWARRRNATLLSIVPKQSVEEGYSGVDDTDTVGFSVNSEAAYNAVMKHFGNMIDHDETSGIMYAPERVWSKIEMVAFDADGEGATRDDGIAEQGVVEGRFELDRKTGQMGHNKDDADQRHGLYLNSKLVKTCNSREEAENVKKRDAKFKDATVKKIAESAENKNNLLLESICHSMTLEQRRIVEGIVKELRPLNEIALNPNQVQQIFQTAQQDSTTAGGNRTAIGQGKDVAVKVNDTINKVGKWLQDTRPVQGFDKKFEQLKTIAGKKFPQLDKQLTSMGAWAKQNPGKTAAIIGILTTIAALAGGPIGGAIAGQVLRGTTELLKGEKVSTAIGKGLKSAAFGYLTGAVLDTIGDWLRTWTLNMVQYTPDIRQAKFSWSEKISWGDSANGGSQTISKSLDSGYFLNADADRLSQLVKTFNSTGNPATKIQTFEEFKKLLAKCAEPEYFERATITDKLDRALAIANNKLYQNTVELTKDIAAGAQGAVQAATGNTKKPAATTTPESINRNFGSVQLTNEGIGDMFKKAAGKVGQWAQTKGQNLTTKVTADKLQSAWKKAGSPTDSDEIAKILQSAGVNTKIITQIYTSMNIPAPAQPAPAQTSTAQPAPAQPAPAPAQPAPAQPAPAQPAPAQPAPAQPAPAQTTGGAGAFGQMVNQLGGASKAAPAVPATAPKRTRTKKSQAVAAPAKQPTTGGAGAFDQMTKQLTKEESMNSASHNPSGAKFGGYYKGTQKGAPRPGQGFGSMEEGIAGNMTVRSDPLTKLKKPEDLKMKAADPFKGMPNRNNLVSAQARNLVAKGAQTAGPGTGAHKNKALAVSKGKFRDIKHKGKFDLGEAPNFLTWAMTAGYNVIGNPAVYEDAKRVYNSLLNEDKSDLKPGQYYIWTAYFDDGTSKRIKIKDEKFDVTKYYADKNQVVVDVDYNWEAH
jgi:hypothetical protein